MIEVFNDGDEGCVVQSPTVTVWMTSHAASVFPDGGLSTVMPTISVNSSGR